MGFNDWIYVDPAPSAVESRLDEVESATLRRLAEQIQPQLRNQLDPGVDLAAAQKAQGVRVREKEGRIIIDENDQAAVLTGGHQFSLASPAKARTVGDLFSSSSGVPSVSSGRLAFRQISENDVFKTTSNPEQEAVERSVTDTLRMGMVDAVEDGMQEVKNLYPGQ